MVRRYVLSAVVLSLGFASATASANSIQVIPDLPSPPVADGSNPGFNIFTYTIVLTANNSIQAGDFFDLVDFAGTGALGTNAATPGAVIWSTTASSWTLLSVDGSSTPAGPVFYGPALPVIPAGSADLPTFAGGEIVVDSSTINDLVFQYTGAATLSSGGTNLVLGQWSIDSSLPGLNLAGSTIVGSDHQNGAFGQNSDPYTPPGTDTYPVPLPPAVATGLLSLGLLPLLRLRRKRALIAD